MICLKAEFPMFHLTGVAFFTNICYTLFTGWETGQSDGFCLPAASGTAPGAFTHGSAGHDRHGSSERVGIV